LTIQKGSRGLIDLETTKLPVCGVETSRIVPHKCLAVARTATLFRVVLAGSRPITTQRDIYDDTLVLEVRADVALCAGEVCECFTPCGWVGTARSDIRRDLRTDPLPYPNTGVTEFHCVNLKVISESVSMEGP
jgi:hypothetical protein